MEIEIKSRLTGQILFAVEAETWGTALEIAVSSGANLFGANLSGANLFGADLSRANLSRANLSGAKNFSKYIITPLLLLLDQPGFIRAYKLIKPNGEGPFNGGINYLNAVDFEVFNANTDETKLCPPDTPGIYLATLDWCIKEWKAGYRILVMEFTAQDIAAIPTATDGKFRVRKCKRVGEKDLVEIGLLEAEKIKDETP